MNVKEVCWNITARCNQECKYCHRFLDVREISLEQNKEILKNLINSKVTEITWTGGEALIYDGIDCLLNVAYKSGIKNKLITNGKVLTDDMIDKIIPYLDTLTLSLDSIRTDTNLLLGRGMDHFSNINRILKYISDKKYDVKVSINTVINRMNLNEIAELVEYFDQFDIYSWRVFKFMPLREMAVKNREVFKISDEEFWCEYNLIKELSNVKKIEFRKKINMENEYILILADGSITVTKNGNDQIIGNALNTNFSNYIFRG